MLRRSLMGALIVLAPLVFTFAMALDIYVPSIPTITIDFATTPAIMQLSISLFMLITGAGQLILGPISDQIGRRKVALISVALFLFGSVFCALAPSVFMLILARMVQAAGACGMMVVAFAIVRDLYSGDESTRMYSYLNSTIAISPLFAPIAGGYISEWYGWRASFLFLGLISAAILLSIWGNVKETLPEEKRIKMGKTLWRNYQKIFSSRTFLMYAFMAAAGLSCFFTFFSVSSYILINLLGVQMQHFGFYFGTIGIVFFVGSVFTGKCAVWIGTYKTVLLGTVFMFLSGIVMLAWYLVGGLSIAGFMGPMAIMGIGGAMVMGGGAGGAIEPYPEIAGTAASLLGAIQFIVASIVASVVLHWEVNSTMPLAITMMALGGLAFLYCLGCRDTGSLVEKEPALDFES